MYAKKMNWLYFIFAFLQIVTSMIIAMLFAGSEARLIKIILKKASRINCYTYIIMYYVHSFSDVEHCAVTSF
jgi:hypothetical protein